MGLDVATPPPAKTEAGPSNVDGDSATWAQQLFHDLVPADLGAPVAFFSAAGLPAPPGFEACWHSCEEASASLSLDEICDASTILVFLADPASATEVARLHRFIQRDNNKLALTALQHYSIAVQGIDAVTHLHLKPSVCHRDIKPENIVFEENGRNVVVKLTDFDMAAHMPRQGARSRTACGTYPFIAPEVLLERVHSGFVADVWALGVVLFDLLGKVGCFQKIYNLPKPKGCPTEEEMRRVQRAVQGRMSSDALSDAVNNGCKELLSSCRALVDGMLEVDVARRFRAEDLKAQVRNLPAPQ